MSKSSLCRIAVGAYIIASAFCVVIFWLTSVIPSPILSGRLLRAVHLTLAFVLSAAWKLSGEEE